MTSSVLRLLLAAGVLALLARAGRVAWSRRDLAVAVWRSVRPRHVGGSLLLLVLSTGTAITTAVTIPATRYGLGDLFGTDGNAVFTPIDVAAEATEVGTSSGGDAAFVVLLTVFLLALALLLPWFAFVEEEVFRAGAETWSLPRRVVAALWFGAAHLVMLVPIAATLGIAVAGFVYGEVYRHGVHAGGSAPQPLREAFRPTRRSRQAVRIVAAEAPVLSSAAPSSEAMEASLRDAATGLAAGLHRQRQVAGLHASTVWHTTFNTCVVFLVWLTLVADVLG